MKSKMIHAFLVGMCVMPLTLLPAAANNASCKVTGSPKNILTDQQTSTIIKNYLAVRQNGIGFDAVDPATKEGKFALLEIIAMELATNAISLADLPHLQTILKMHHQHNNRYFAIKLLNNTICVLKK